MCDKIENNKFAPVMSDQDLKLISSFFLNNYKNCAHIHVHAVYFYISYLNGDRAAEKAIKTKVQDVKVMEFSTVTDKDEPITIQYFKRRILNNKMGMISMKDAFAVVPMADDTDLIQPYTVITASVIHYINYNL